MVITASIVTHLTPAGQLTTALECLLRSEVKRIYVVDNSPDDSLRGVAGAYGRVEYMHVENRGFGEGHNLAIRNALADPDGFHLVMNADVWWDGDIIAPLLRYLKDNPSVGMVAPKVYYPDGVLQYSCRMLPTPLDLFAKRFLPSFLSRHRMDRYLLAGHDHDFPLDCPYLLGSFLLFRNKALLDCGLFDERFFMYPEDIDITRRIHQRWATMYWPGVSIVHEHAAASRKSLKMLRIHLSNMMRYFNKWGWWTDGSRLRFNRRLQREIVQIPESRQPEARG